MQTSLKKITGAAVVVALAGWAPLAAQAEDARSPRALPTVDSRINVQFVDVESYTDVRERWHGTTDEARDHLLEQLRVELQRRGERVLADGLHLTVRVLDVDLAGDFEPWRFRGQDDIRIVKDIYPARIRLEYELSDSTGTVLASGERSLNSFGLSTSPLSGSDALRHEKELLRRWISSEFREHRRG